MKDSAPRFATPLDTPRPRGADLFEAFSPKLGRRVRLFNRANFNQWIRLEADPSVLFQCERPARLGIDCDARLIDFWVRRDGLEELLVLAHGEAEPAVPDQFGGVALRVIAPAELAAANIWVTNWQRMLPVINATLPGMTLRNQPGPTCHGSNTFASLTGRSSAMEHSCFATGSKPCYVRACGRWRQSTKTEFHFCRHVRNTLAFLYVRRLPTCFIGW